MLIVVSKIIMGVAFVLDHNAIMHPSLFNFCGLQLPGHRPHNYESS